MKWLSLLLIVGCAQVTSLNLKKHQFGLQPTKIIWFQVAGLEEEQIGMIRFQQNAGRKTSFEGSLCIGQAWNYNLFNLRNSAQSSFFSQLTGKKNIKENCEDASLRPIWDYVYPSGYMTAIIESGAVGNQSILSLKKCGDEGKVLLENLFIYKRSKPTDRSSTFHYAEKVDLARGQVYFDRSCGEVSCGSSVLNDFEAIYDRFKKVSPKHLMIIRDFSYLNSLKKRDFAKSKEILIDLEKTFGEALKLTESSDYLVLLTSGESKFVDLPDQGVPFYEFVKENKNANVKRTKLTNMVLASGSRAENFCGIYDESEILQRILSGPKQQGLELKIINPFK